MELQLEDTVILLDTSRSMFRKDFSPNRLGAAKKAIKDFVIAKNQIDDRDQFALVSFSSEAKVLLEMTPYVDDVLEAIDNVLIGGTSGLGEGLAVALQLIVKEIQQLGEKTYRMLILSDGKSWGSTIDPVRMAKIACGLNVKIDCIGLSELGLSYSDSALEQIASQTNGEYRKIYDSSSLDAALQELSAKKEVSSSARKADDGAMSALLQTIAADLLRPADLSEDQSHLVDLLIGKEKSKCIICFQDVCPICHGPFYSCGRYCPNCKSPMHLHCAAEWAAASKAVSGENIFRCTRCYFLLKVPASYSKIKVLKGTHHYSTVQEQQEEDTALFVKVTEFTDELAAAVDPICHSIFDSEENVYQCTNCGTFYHAQCLDKWLEDKSSGGACRVCGKKIVL
ncbi:MAG: VWA domain-containing protein [Candidatus Helarchaeales archaeon]